MLYVKNECSIFHFPRRRSMMAKDYSFDVVCRTDLQEAANAINQAAKEISTRYDFKGSKSSVTLESDKITIIGDDEFKLKLVKEIVHGKLVKRGISLKNLNELKKEAAAGGTVRQILELQNGISSELAKDIVKRVKASKIKVAAKINGDEVRVSGKDKDCLQECIQFLKQQDLSVELQFTNYR
jgi:cyclic-di-GMP-binding protein